MRVLTYVEVPTGLRIRTTYPITCSRDFDYPLRDFERFWRRHPELRIDREARAVLEDIRHRRRKMAVAEFAAMIDGAWGGPWPEVPV